MGAAVAQRPKIPRMGTVPAEARAAILERALRFYADRGTYDGEGAPLVRTESYGVLVPSLDLGQTARTALRAAGLDTDPMR